jgi:hypothetical protein
MSWILHSGTNRDKSRNEANEDVAHQTVMRVRGPYRWTANSAAMLMLLLLLSTCRGSPSLPQK